MLVGKASGKRTLADVMDLDIAMKKKWRGGPTPKITQSKFFGQEPASSEKPKTTTRKASGSQGRKEVVMSVPGPSRLREEKENIYIVIDGDDDDTEIDAEPITILDSDCDVSLVAQDTEMDLEELPDNEMVKQEDGYISPTSSCSGDAQDLSSPYRPRRRWRSSDIGGPEVLDFAEAISSPPQTKRRPSRLPSRASLRTSRSLTPTRGHRDDSSLRKIKVCERPIPVRALSGPDLRDSFGDELMSEIDCFEDEGRSTSGPNSPPLPSPATPNNKDCTDQGVDVIVVDLLEDPEESLARALVARTEVVANGWRDRWAHGSGSKRELYLQASKTPLFRRRETNVTPAGRHSTLQPQSHLCSYPRVTPRPAPSKSILKPKRGPDKRGLPFFEASKPKDPDINGKAATLKKHHAALSGLEIDTIND